MPQTYTFASWNVNGLRAVLKKDPSFIQIAQELDVDILALQETKLQEGQVDIDLPGYHQTWSYAERKGYSGTAVFSRQEPLRVLHADALLPYAGEGEAAALVAQRAKRTRPHRRAHGLGRCLPRLFERARARDRQTRRDLWRL